MRIARIYAHQLTFDLRNAKFVEYRLVIDGGILDLLQCAKDCLARRSYSRPILFCYKVRPQVRRQAAAAEDELRLTERGVEHLLRLSGERRIFEKLVIMFDGFF